MPDDGISRLEYMEFKERIIDWHKHTQKDLEDIKEKQDEFSKMNTNIELLASNMSSMVEELKQQSSRLEKLENRDGEKWRDTVKYVVTALISAIIGALTRFIG